MKAPRADHMRAPRADPGIAALLARRFEAIVFDWDGIAAPDRPAAATRLRRLVEDACEAGIELAIVSDADVETVDGELAARPGNRGGLVLALNRGSEVFRVGRDGPQLVKRHRATGEEEAALSRAAELTVERLEAHGLKALIVSERLNRRRIDLIAEPECTDPSPARAGELRVAVKDRPAPAGIAGLTGALDIASAAAEHRPGHRLRGVHPGSVRARPPDPPVRQLERSVPTVSISANQPALAQSSACADLKAGGEMNRTRVTQRGGRVSTGDLSEDWELERLSVERATAEFGAPSRRVDMIAGAAG